MSLKMKNSFYMTKALGSGFELLESISSMSVGKKIAQHRKRRNITQAELAERLHIHQTQVARWEKDRSRPRPDYLAQISDVLDVPVDELTADEPQNLLDIEDPELRDLLFRIKELSPRQAEALKVMLQDMLKLSRFQKVMHD